MANTKQLIGSRWVERREFLQTLCLVNLLWAKILTSDWTEQDEGTSSLIRIDLPDDRSKGYFQDFGLFGKKSSADLVKSLKVIKSIKNNRRNFFWQKRKAGLGLTKSSENPIEKKVPANILKKVKKMYQMYFQSKKYYWMYRKNELISLSINTIK